MRRGLPSAPYLLALLAAAALPLTVGGRAVNPTPDDNAASAEALWTPKSGAYVRAAHYWGDEWVKNFWSSDLSRMDRDLAQIKSDGFDTIVIVIPWTEFQPKLFPPRVNPVAFRRLETVMRAAERHRLGVVARISYTWDFHPGADLPTLGRFAALYHDPRVYRAWLAYIAALSRSLQSFPNFRFAFLTWEDFWQLAYEPDHATSEEARRRVAQATGFDDYLRTRFTLEEVRGELGQPVERWEDVAVPARKTAAFRLYLDFVDHELVNRIYVPARSRFPRLSMEARVDWDQLWTDPDAEPGWYRHDAQFHLPGAPFVTIYWAPAMGALNVGEEESAQDVLARLERILKYTNDLSGGKIFIDQLIYRDNSLQFRRNARVRANEVRAFLRCTPSGLRRYTRGFAIWAYRDYATSAVYNPSFALGLSGWHVSGRVERPRSGGGVVLEPGSTVAQAMPRARDPEVKWASHVYVELRARSARGGPATLRVRLASLEPRTVRLGSRERRARLSFPRERVPSYDLELRAGRRAAIVSDVQVYSFVASGGMRRRNGTAGPEVAAVRELNAAVAHPSVDARTAAQCTAGA